MAKACAEVGSTVHGETVRAVIERAGITTICLMAACPTGDLVQARRWLAAHPPARRPQMAQTCSKLGNLALAPGRAP